MENKGLLKLPETWHIKLTQENAETIKSYFKGFRQYDIGFAFGMVNGKISSRIASWANDMGQQITFADFKRLVLGEKNADDYGVLGCEELAVYFRHNNIEYLEGWIKENIYYILSEWDYEDFENSKRQSLPLTEYLKLIDEKPESMESKQNEITIVKTWETIYFKTENATVELTLNHEKKTFDLQTATEEMVSFKSDTIEVARERLKCIECALNYAEKYLNQ